MVRWVLAACVVVRSCLGAAPAVSKVEPPDWVAETAGITLRLLVSGTGFQGVRVQAPFPTDRLSVSDNGTHLFVDVSIPANVKPGQYPLRLVTGGGSTEAPFSIVPALPSQGRFQGFSSDDVVYLIMPDRFANGDVANDDPAISRGLYDRSKSRYYHGGDLEGIIQRLPYIKSLGVTAIWMTPIYDNANQLNHREKYDNQAITDYHGYGAVDFYGVDEHFGTLDKFRELVDKAHAAGIKVIQDEVANHTGPYHPWVKDPPTPTWFNGTEAKHINETWQTWTLIDPYATVELQKGTLDGWFANILPDLNQNDPECARYLIQNTLWWIGRTGIDGIREDTVPYVPRAFWTQWTTAIRKHYPSFNMVGEVFDADPVLVASFQKEVPSVFDFPLHYAIRKVFAGGAPPTELSKVLAHDALYRDTSQLVTFVDLHDIKRFMSEPGATIEGLQQVFTFLMTMRGIPMIYYGDEVAMSGGDDPDNRRDFPGGWTGDAKNAFEVRGRSREQERLVEHLQLLGRMRANSEALRHGNVVELMVDNDGYAFARKNGNESALMVFNRAAEAKDWRIPMAGAGIANGVSLRDGLGKASAVTVREGFVDVHIPAHSSVVYLTH